MHVDYFLQPPPLFLFVPPGSAEETLLFSSDSRFPSGFLIVSRTRRTRNRFLVHRRANPLLALRFLGLTANPARCRQLTTRDAAPRLYGRELRRLRHRVPGRLGWRLHRGYPYSRGGMNGKGAISGKVFAFQVHRGIEASFFGPAICFQQHRSTLWESGWGCQVFFLATPASRLVADAPRSLAPGHLRLEASEAPLASELTDGSTRDIPRD